MIRKIKILALSFAIGCLSSAPVSGQTVAAHQNVVRGPAVNDVGAEIVPMIWRAEIGQAVASVPLAGIDHFGIQDYNVDGHARVRELTITMKSLSLVRIYHLLPLGAIHKEGAERLETLQELLEDNTESLRKQDDELPIKTFPVTTHKAMVEFRVSEAGDIDALYDSLEKAMTDHLAASLIPAQRPQVIRVMTVGKRQ